ncbi:MULTISPECIES: SDR family oxidoreductase [Streptomyces]|uniref:SDR family oxidoreductase n=1 Tax=Streptomyces TaxID=1883 RepID=UPI001D14439C|nr:MULTISPECIES: SDR family oxidoreductase [Streptomyces]MCC3653901.1 SDR family oxidoreductase [Streptomyces sp. S07_1.15]WSQ71583.1 SDR family oxidoreductase [Streptomyces xinghaiensis]
MTADKLAVVTGASTGIGRATAEELARRGFHVLAGVRRQEDADRAAGPGVEPVIVDITEEEQVAALAGRVARDPHGRPLGVLVNNAGVALNAPAETIPLAEWRRHFDVNLFGHVAVTRALLPALVAAGDARLINVSSIGGRVAFPTYGAYAAAKFGLEGYSDALRREVARCGVKVVLVEPGTVATPIWGKGIATMEAIAADMTADQHARYDDLVAALRKQSEQQAGQGVRPHRAARVIVAAATARRPRTRYLVGRDAKLLARLTGLLSDRMVDGLIARQLGLAGPGARPA